MGQNIRENYHETIKFDGNNKMDWYYHETIELVGTTIRQIKSVEITMEQ